MNGIELWGGIECTINRVGDCYIDQLARCGHYSRLEDLDRFAALGIKRLRYPFLWERIAPNGVRHADWRWSDEVLRRLRDLSLEPIVALVHHGSGPPATHLLDPAFVEGLTGYARAFAERYPWVRWYTPINEPLTTARFSGLYGHWYPHCRNDRFFATALIHECRAIVSAMAAIRQVAGDAHLLQTEDAGSTRSTPALADQATFENHRRWLSLDLLTGRVTPDLPLWGYLRSAGIDHKDLEWFQRNPSPPAIVGLNYYVTSDRYLDDRLDQYPSAAVGGNGPQCYVDVEAARVKGVGIRGHAAVLEDAWCRYQLPVAITEAHLGCTREDQMRWLMEAWQGAQRANARGADVRAVTAWALLGSWDWDSLVTRVADKYEPGVFDVRGPIVRPTALAGLVSELALGRSPDHPILAIPGWWRRDTAQTISHSTGQVLITGATGTLGRAFAYACRTRGIPFTVLSRPEMDITSVASVRAAVMRWRPWAMINAAGYVRVDDAERDWVACRRANALGPAILAAVCRKAGVRLLTFSSDLVFDGRIRRPYIESDSVSPLNVYGRTKAEAEHRVLAIDRSALVVRTSALFGPWDAYNFVASALDALTAGRPVRAASDTIVSPTYVPDLVHTTLDLLIDGATGVWHLANAAEITWADFAIRVAQLAGLDPSPIEACASRCLQLAARRPSYSALGTERGQLMPALDDSLARYMRERVPCGTAA